MFTFFTIVFAIVWAVVSFILLFKVWDNIGPIVLKEPYRAAPRHGDHLPHHLGRSRLALDEDFRVIHLQTTVSEGVKPRLLRVSGFFFWPKLFFAFLSFR